jgi:hypothetical protein
MVPENYPNTMALAVVKDAAMMKQFMAFSLVILRFLDSV